MQTYRFNSVAYVKVMILPEMAEAFTAALSYLTLLWHCETLLSSVWVVFILSDFNAAPHAVRLSPYKKIQQQATSTALNVTKWVNRTRTFKNTSSSLWGCFSTQNNTHRRAVTHCRKVAWMFLTQYLTIGWKAEWSNTHVMAALNPI